MARVTVEDCIEKVPNRFELVLLADVRLDEVTIVAGLLHDVVEDTKIDIGDIEVRFGADVAELVDGVTKLDKLEFASKEAAQAENSGGTAGG